VFVGLVVESVGSGKSPKYTGSRLQEVYNIESESAVNSVNVDILVRLILLTVF